MSFERILQSIVDECGGGFGITLMGLDGIPIEQTVPAGGPRAEDPFEGDVTTAGIEFGRILADMNKASDTLGTGRVRETVIGLDRATLIVHGVEDDLMVVLAISPDGNLGKARYLIRRNLNEIRAQL